MNAATKMKAAVEQILAATGNPKPEIGIYRIENPPYMDLYIHAYGDIVYAAHSREEYRGKNNPDDPGMGFWINPEDGKWYASYIEQMLTGGAKVLALNVLRERMIGHTVGPFGQSAANKFSGGWAANLLRQGFANTGLKWEFTPVSEDDAEIDRRRYYLLKGEVGEMNSINSDKTRILHTSGEVTINADEQPPFSFDLKRLRQIVGGYITIVYLPNEMIMVALDDSYGEPINYAATVLMRKAFGRSAYPIFGNVLVCKSSQVK